jgi:hypothetical protein
MRIVSISIAILQLIILPPLLQACCGGFGGDDDTYYDIDEMTLEIQLINPATTSSKLSDINFIVAFQVTYAAIESTGGATLYACSPAPTISNNQVIAVAITSNRDLITTAGTASAGENLSFQFRVHGTGHINDPVSDLIGNPLLDNKLVFTSDAELSAEQSHIFTFKITLDNGRVFAMEATELTFLQG